MHTKTRFQLLSYSEAITDLLWALESSPALMPSSPCDKQSATSRAHPVGQTLGHSKLPETLLFWDSIDLVSPRNPNAPHSGPGLNASQIVANLHLTRTLHCRYRYLH